MGAMPRTVNFVTGPSRTGDIEQRIQLGAHGPRRLHVVLVDEPEAVSRWLGPSADEITLWRRAMRDVAPLRGRPARTTPVPERRHLAGPLARSVTRSPEKEAGRMPALRNNRLQYRNRSTGSPGSTAPPPTGSSAAAIPSPDGSICTA